jgi:hypothetical protein
MSGWQSDDGAYTRISVTVIEVALGEYTMCCGKRHRVTWMCPATFTYSTRPVFANRLREWINARAEDWVIFPIMRLGHPRQRRKMNRRIIEMEIARSQRQVLTRPT